MASTTGSPRPSGEHRGQLPPPAGPRACAPRGDVTILLTRVPDLRVKAVGSGRVPALPVSKPESDGALSQTLALQTRSCGLSALQDGGHSWHCWTLPCLRPCSPHRLWQPSGLLAMQLTPPPPPASWACRGTRGEGRRPASQTRRTHTPGARAAHTGDRWPHVLLRRCPTAPVVHHKKGNELRFPQQRFQRNRDVLKIPSFESLTSFNI